ncbi:MAG: hypothetical protein EWV83_06285 [Microcystis sp. M_OC_Ca_00000000_S217Cul]|nr:MAG: hypothetical protein EWV83_06285 [Microcystis sp. M_OC_Ca_00000000_S217Cul]TRT91344.1 MAG: hypothetical protein EWV66_06460 [Microcystis sp. M_OC_Ca_00000000_C217Col]
MAGISYQLSVSSYQLSVISYQLSVISDQGVGEWGNSSNTLKPQHPNTTANSLRLFFLSLSCQHFHFGECEGFFCFLLLGCFFL